MPEYLAPGVYVEEVSFRNKSIEGVSTTTTGFIGPTRYGPLDLEPDIITSLGEFERTYGDRQQLDYGGTKIDNYMWHAARAFFEEGGKRLYVTRVFGRTDPDDADEGVASSSAFSHGGKTLTVKARFPGAAGNVKVRISLNIGQNILGQDKDGNRTFSGLLANDVVVFNDIVPPVASSPAIGGNFYIAKPVSVGQQVTWTFSDSGGTALTSPLSNLNLASPLNSDVNANDQVRIVTLTVSVTLEDGTNMVWGDLAPDPAHSRNGIPDSITELFSANPSSLAQARTLPIVVDRTGLTTGLDVIQAIFGTTLGFTSPISPLTEPLKLSSAFVIEDTLTGGSDGIRPTASDYEGKADPDSTTKTGLNQLEDQEDISIIAAPGCTYLYNGAYNSNANTIINLLIGHAQRMRYRIAVLDCGNNQSISEVRAMRARFDSTYAALYYPWIRVLDPVTQREIYLPPSGFVAGIYARNDIQRAVYKAPANEVVTLAIGFERLLNKAQQDVLNPEGINAFRFFEGRGFRLWGARTISSDPEWKYVNLRRYFAYLERSIDRGTQWAVFEPNGEALWANVRSTVEDFLFNEWSNGALLGEKPDKAYFVRCDRSTMTQNDLDNGRLVCLIGVAPLRPAEFVIFRIGQWTADRKR